MLSHMLRAVQQPTASSSGVTFLQSAIDEVNRANYSFTGISLGTPSSTRQIFVVSQVRHTSTGAINSVTINGVSATVSSITTPSPPIKLLIARAVVPTGTSGTIEINTASTADRCTIFVYSVERSSSSLTLTDSISSAVASGATSYTSSSLTTNAGGVSFGIITKNTTGPFTYSGVTSVPSIDVVEAAGVLGSWYTDNSTGGSSITPDISVTWSSSAGIGVYGGSF